MPSADRLVAAAKAVQVMDVAGRIIADPSLAAASPFASEMLALAWAAEGLNAIVIEAELLVRALKLPITGNDHDDAARDHAIETQMATLDRQFALLRAANNPTEQETDHADR